MYLPGDKITSKKKRSKTIYKVLGYDGSTGYIYALIISGPAQGKKRKLTRPENYIKV